jgi:hypothetical protein
LNFYSGDQNREDQLSAAYGRNRGKKIVYRALVRKPEGNRSLGKHCRRWGDHIKIDLKGIK